MPSEEGHFDGTVSVGVAEDGHHPIFAKRGRDLHRDLYRPGRGSIFGHAPGPDKVPEASAGRLRFTTDLAEAAEFAAVHFIGVATPGQADGSYDLSQARRCVPWCRTCAGNN